MAPATAGLLAGIPPSHLPGLLGGAAAPAVARLRRRPDAISTLLLVTAGIHLGLVVGHGGEPVLSALFLVDGLAFLAAAAAPRRPWWWRGLTGLLLVGTIAAYLVVVGVGRDQPDPVGVLDKLVELVALGLVLLPHRRSSDGWRRTVRWLAASGSILALTLLAGAGMWVEDLAGGGHPHEAGAAACIPSGHHPAPGTVLRPVPCAATPQQQAAAARLVARTRAGIARYEDVRVALSAGYRPSTPDLDGTVHYADLRQRRAASPLDPSHPAALVYADTRHGPVLLGAMYEMPAVGEPGPDIGGELTPWHYHTNVCFSLPGLFVSGLSTPFGQCPPGSIRITTADMLHVWTAPNPNGPFGDLDPAWLHRLEKS